MPAGQTQTPNIHQLSVINWAAAGSHHPSTVLLFTCTYSPTCQGMNCGIHWRTPSLYTPCTGRPAAAPRAALSTGTAGTEVGAATAAQGAAVGLMRSAVGDPAITPLPSGAGRASWGKGLPVAGLGGHGTRPLRARGLAPPLPLVHLGPVVGESFPRGRDASKVKPGGPATTRVVGSDMRVVLRDLFLLSCSLSGALGSP